MMGVLSNRNLVSIAFNISYFDIENSLLHRFLPFKEICMINSVCEEREVKQN